MCFSSQNPTPTSGSTLGFIPAAEINIWKLVLNYWIFCIDIGHLFRFIYARCFNRKKA